MSEEEQIRLKKRCNRDAGIKKNWRDLEEKMNTHSPRDFRLGNKGWQSDKTTVWWED